MDNLPDSKRQRRDVIPQSQELNLPLTRMMNYLKMAQLRRNRIRREELTKKIVEEVKEALLKDYPIETPDTEYYKVAINIRSTIDESHLILNTYYCFHGEHPSNVLFVDIYASIVSPLNGQFWHTWINYAKEKQEDRIQHYDIYEEINVRLCEYMKNDDQIPMISKCGVTCETHYDFLELESITDDRRPTFNNILHLTETSTSSLKSWNEIWATLNQ